MATKHRDEDLPKGLKAVKEGANATKLKFLDSIKTTADIEIPQDPLMRVIGQDEALK